MLQNNSTGKIFINSPLTQATHFKKATLDKHGYRIFDSKQHGQVIIHWECLDTLHSEIVLGKFSREV